MRLTRLTTCHLTSTSNKFFTFRFNNDFYCIDD